MKSGKKIAVISHLMMSLLLPNMSVFANIVYDKGEFSGSEESSWERADSRNYDHEL